MSQRPGHILGCTGVAEACASSQWSNVTCARGHRPARSRAGVGTDTTPTDPSGKRADTHVREGERGAAGNRANFTRERPGDSTAAVRQREGQQSRRGQSRPDALCGTTTDGDRAPETR
jgi:hypothetical protein